MWSVLASSIGAILEYNYYFTTSHSEQVSVGDFEQAIVCWDTKWYANATESKNVLSFY